MLNLTTDEFYGVLDDAMDSIPDELFNKIDNVMFDVVDEPLKDEISFCVDPGFELLGLYRGIPLNVRSGSTYGFMTPPDRIWVFKNPILRVSWNPQAAKEQARKTLLHEIGHHFGMTDAELAKRGY